MKSNRRIIENDLETIPLHWCAIWGWTLITSIFQLKYKETWYVCLQRKTRLWIICVQITGATGERSIKSIHASEYSQIMTAYAKHRNSISKFKPTRRIVVSHSSLCSLKMSFSLEQPFPTCAYSVHGLILGKPQLWNVFQKVFLKTLRKHLSDFSWCGCFNFKYTCLS